LLIFSFVNSLIVNKGEDDVRKQSDEDNDKKEQRENLRYQRIRSVVKSPI